MEETTGTHYTCPECHGVSPIAKSCGTDGCAFNGQPLHECHCDDGQHAESHEVGAHD